MFEDEIVDIVFDEDKFNELYDGSEKNKSFSLIKAKGIFNSHKDKILNIHRKKKHLNKIKKLGVKYYKIIYGKISTR